MPIDRTDETALKELTDKYGDQIEKYEYQTWKEPYLAKEPKGAFCCGMTRYRKYFKVSHIKLKNGTRIPVGAGCLIRVMTFLILSSLIFII